MPFFDLKRRRSVFKRPSAESTAIRATRGSFLSCCLNLVFLSSLLLAFVPYDARDRLEGGVNRLRDIRVKTFFYILATQLVAVL